MATRNPTAPTEAQPSESFDKLLRRLLNLVQHLQLADQRLQNDFAQIPEEYQAAATALHDATAALDKLHTDFDRWHAQGLAEAFEQTEQGKGAQHHRGCEPEAVVSTFRMTVPAVSGAGTFTAASVEALIEAYERWRDENGLGSSDIGSRFPVCRDGVKVGELSYNGRWRPG